MALLSSLPIPHLVPVVPLHLGERLLGDGVDVRVQVAHVLRGRYLYDIGSILGTLGPPPPCANLLKDMIGIIC